MRFHEGPAFFAVGGYPLGRSCTRFPEAAAAPFPWAICRAFFFPRRGSFEGGDLWGRQGDFEVPLPPAGGQNHIVALLDLALRLAFFLGLTLEHLFFP